MTEFQKINHLYKKTLVFHIGCGSGFFSEYNNMVFSIAYCLINRIKFKLYSRDANFAYNKGWTDFFEPFCDEVFESFHSSLNRRQRFPSLFKLVLKKVMYRNPIPRWAFDKFSWYMIKQYIKEPYYKCKYGFNYYTFELWNRFTKYNPYNFENVLNKNVTTDIYSGELRFLIKKIIDLTWKYKSEIETEIMSLVVALNVPKEYLGIHIRLGDKVLEDKLFGYDEYFDLLNIKNEDIACKNIFILTDDYSVIEKVKLKYPEFNIYTLCEPYERGYNNDNFNCLSNDLKKTNLLRVC